MRKKMKRDNKSISEIGLFLRQQRLKAGLTQGQVARKLGLTSPQFISNIERGVADPPVLTVRILVQLYKMNPDKLVDFMVDSSRKELQKYFKLKK